MRARVRVRVRACAEASENKQRGKYVVGIFPKFLKTHTHTHRADQRGDGEIPCQFSPVSLVAVLWRFSWVFRSRARFEASFNKRESTPAESFSIYFHPHSPWPTGNDSFEEVCTAEAEIRLGIRPKSEVSLTVPSPNGYYIHDVVPRHKQHARQLCN